MRAAITAAMWVGLTGCGTILEVPVEGGSSDGSATSTSGADAGTVPTSSTAGGETSDRDTDDSPGTGGSTGAPQDVPFVCAVDGVVFDEEGMAEVSLEVAGHGTAADVDIGVRMSHDDLANVQVFLVRGGDELLLLPASPENACAMINAFFDSDATAPATEACLGGADGEALRVQPVDDLSPLVGQSADGTWMVRAVGPAGTAGIVEGVCIALPEN